ncbi:hypothetical protein T4A_3866 [Trichinella pseudospiralis]|uniref:Uncharacterized protein n=1 Tax=Trichinella pseudospiralis TaxID=6337 RepID=A0A0V0YCB9_TRIPS|nr:hypothetical protein T4E_955 [Trichinella pseudospiralis]KRY70721.1 hypothetical protein T4A_3866 [Trichinella pseudospiralis]
MKAAYAKQSKAGSQRRPAALLSAVLWPDYTRAFVTASARSGRRRAPHSAGRLLLPAVDNQSIRLDWQSNRPIHGNATQPRPTSERNWEFYTYSKRTPAISP